MRSGSSVDTVARAGAVAMAVLVSKSDPLYFPSLREKKTLSLPLSR